MFQLNFNGNKLNWITIKSKPLIIDSKIILFITNVTARACILSDVNNTHAKKGESGINIY